MLAAVTTPTMILHGALDDVCNYEGNAVRTFTYLGTEERYLITVNQQRHGVFSDQPGSRNTLRRRSWGTTCRRRVLQAIPD